MSEPTVFDKIVSGEFPSYKVWEDDNYLAFLSRWPNTPGFTVVVPKKNPGANYLDAADDVYTGLLVAAKKVATKLRKAFNVDRVGLIIEGEGVPHLHIKLIPMHDSGERDKHEPVFNETYQGYLITVDGPEASSEELQAVQKKIQEAA